MTENGFTKNNNIINILYDLFCMSIYDDTIIACVQITTLAKGHQLEFSGFANF